MWWFGNDLREEELRFGLDRLEALLGDGAAFTPGLLGFGTALQHERRMLLLVVDQSRDPRPELWIPGSDGPARLVRRWLRRYDLPLPTGEQPPRPSNDTWSLAAVALGAAAAVGAAVALGAAGGVGWVAVLGRVGRRSWWVRQLTELSLAVDAARSADPRSGLVVRGLAVPLDQADEDSQVLVDRIGLPREDVLVSYWPVPKATNGHLRGIRRRPTASPGFQLVVEAPGPVTERFLATAGHFAVEETAPVYRSVRRFVRGPAIGTMRRRLDPRAAAEPSRAHLVGAVDLGLVALTGDGLTAESVEVQPAEEVAEFATGRWTGATSGRAVGQVVGALRMIEVGGVRLANCWFLLGDCRPGDSGAAVVHESGRVLGQVVGARGTSRVNGSRPGTVVQDAELLLETAAGVLGLSRAQLTPAVVDPL